LRLSLPDLVRLLPGETLDILALITCLALGSRFDEAALLGRRGGGC
jgi:hypothetical protein